MRPTISLFRYAKNATEILGDQNVILQFHENVIKDKEKSIRRILKILGMPHQSIFDYKSYAEGQSLPIGYGGYKASREIVLCDQIHLINKMSINRDQLICDICNACKKEVGDFRLIENFRSFYLSL